MRVFLSHRNKLLKKFKRCTEEGDGDEDDEGQTKWEVFRSVCVAVRRQTKAHNQKEQSGKCGEGRKVAEIRMPVGPVAHPIGDPPNSAHVRMRPEHAVDDGREQRERERDDACSKDET